MACNSHMGQQRQDRPHDITRQPMPHQAETREEAPYQSETQEATVLQVKTREAVRKGRLERPFINVGLRTSEAGEAVLLHSGTKGPLCLRKGHCAYVHTRQAISHPAGARETAPDQNQTPTRETTLHHSGTAEPTLCTVIIRKPCHESKQTKIVADTTRAL